MVKYFLMLVALTGVVSGPALATQQQDFWAWFQANRDFLTQYAANTAAVTGAVGNRLQNVDRGLTFEMGRAPDGVYEFIVSADGIRDVFPEVRRLVKAAPEIENWRIIAFRPRRPDALELNLEYAGIEVSGGDLWYSLAAEGGQLALTLFVKSLTRSNHDVMADAGFIMLDQVLGEYDTATKLRFIDFAPLPPDPEAAGLKPLGDLAEEVDRRFAQSQN